MGGLRDIDELLRLVAMVNAAATSPDGFGDAFDRLSDLTGGSRIMIGEAGHNGDHFAFAGHRIDPELVQLVNGELGSRTANPLFGAMPRAPLHVARSLTGRMPRKKLLKSAIYGEVLRPSAVRHVMAVVLSVDQRRAQALVLGRGIGGDYDRDAASFLGRLAPHVAGALETHERVGAAMRDLTSLDGLADGMAIVDAEGRIRHANREARRILIAADGLSSHHGKIVAGRQADMRALSRAMAACCQHGIEPAETRLAIGRPSCSSDYLVRVSPMDMHVPVGPVQSRQSAALIVIVDPERDTPPTARTLERLYGLTPAEAAIAVHIHDGESLAEAATAQNISVNTAKTQLKAVYDKLGITRQSQLVRKIALLP